jgi:hypothetical protein
MRDLAERIVAIHDQLWGAYGAPKVHVELRDRGWRRSHKRVARLLRQARRGPKRWRTTTVPGRDHPAEPDPT